MKKLITLNLINTGMNANIRRFLLFSVEFFKAKTPVATSQLEELNEFFK